MFLILGAFLIPYLIMLALAGKPMYFLELAIGQFGGVGPIAIWNCCPLMKGELHVLFNNNFVSHDLIPD
jgi:SNF family Na+-dependent transporter